MGISMTCATYKAIERLRNVRDEIEMALRPPGARITLSRQVAEAILDDVSAVGRLIRVAAECRGDG